MWTEVIKAKERLPQANIERWLELLSSKENIERFMKRLRGGYYDNEGIARTLTFLRSEPTEQNLANAASLDYDEEEIVDRFLENKDTIINFLINRTNRVAGLKVRSNKIQGEALRLENTKMVLGLFDELVEANPPGRIKLNSLWGRKLLALEEYLVSHPKILTRMRKTLLNKYSSFFANWAIPGSAPPSKDPSYEKEWWDKSDRRLATLYKLFGKPVTTSEYTANTLDEEMTAKYYHHIAKLHSLLIPEEISPSNMADNFYRKTRNQTKINPNLRHLLESDNPIPALATKSTDLFRERFTGAQSDKQAEETRSILSMLGDNPLVLSDAFIQEYIINEKEDLEREDLGPVGEENLKLLTDFEQRAETESFAFEGQTYQKIVARPALKNKLRNYYKEKLSLLDDEFIVPKDLLIISQDKVAYNSVDEAIKSINIELLDGEVEYTFGNIIDFLNVVIEVDQALDLGNLPDDLPEELAPAFEKAFTDIKARLQVLAQEQINDIVANPTTYAKIPPIKSAYIEQEETPMGLSEVERAKEYTIFDALIRGGFING